LARTHTLQKHERLKSKKLIDRLFSEGNSLYAHPIKLLYLSISPEDLSDSNASSLIFGVTVPKKRFPLSPDRNLIKRRIREAYRLHKLPLQEKLAARNVTVCLMCIYARPEKGEYAVIEKGVKKLLKKLDENLFADS